MRGGLGSYEMTLEPVKAGEHLAHILLQEGGQATEITGSPVKFHVSPAVPSAAKSVLSRPDSVPLLINQACDILLTTHDRYGNPLDRGGTRVDVRAQGVAASACTVEDNKDSTYNIRMTAGAPGEVRVTVRIENVELPPFTVLFTKGDVLRPD